jgi:hypothetical protein
VSSLEIRFEVADFGLDGVDLLLVVTKTIGIASVRGSAGGDPRELRSQLRKTPFFLCFAHLAPSS